MEGYSIKRALREVPAIKNDFTEEILTTAGYGARRSISQPSAVPGVQEAVSADGVHRPARTQQN